MKKFLYTVAAVYVVAAVVGVALFRSPNYSAAYLDKFHEEHERHHSLLANEEFKIYLERPHLVKADAKTTADAEFVKEYEARPEYQAEVKRIFRYTMYFKVLNSTIFILIIVVAAKNPLLGFLDKQIGDIRAALDNAERARKEAAVAKAAASEKLGAWEDTAKGIRKETDTLIAKQLGELAQEFEDAKQQVAKEEQERRQAEEFRAAKTLKEELVTQALTALEQRYKAQGPDALLGANVDSFVRFMEGRS